MIMFSIQNGAKGAFSYLTFLCGPLQRLNPIVNASIQGKLQLLPIVYPQDVIELLQRIARCV